jgi:hypothetical protein
MATASVNISNFIASMDSSALSPLDPAAQLGSAHTQFLTDLSAAKGGDANASGNVLTDAQNYLKLAQAFDGAATAPYAAAYADVKSLLQTFVAANPVVVAVSATTNAVNSGTNAITAGTSAATTGLNNILAQLKAMTGNTLSPTSGGPPGGSSSPVVYPAAGSYDNLVTQELAGGHGPGGSFTAADLAALTSAATQDGFHFAKGGMVTGGTPGVDSVRAMLMPQERVLSVSDNSELIDQIRMVNDRLSTLVGVLVEHSAMTEEQLVALNATSSTAASTNKRQQHAA